MRLCICEQLALAAFWSLLLGVSFLGMAVLDAAHGHVGGHLALFVVCAVVFTASMISRRAFQVAAKRIGYQPTQDGGVRVTGQQVRLGPPANVGDELEAEIQDWLGRRP